MPGRKAKGEIMSKTEMIETEKHNRSSKIYKAEALEISSKSISQIVGRGLAEMEIADNAQKINLCDTDLVKAVSKTYIQACADASTLPTMAGLARAMGCSRRILYIWMKERHDTDTGKWLTMCHDLFSDLLAEASLRNNTQPIVSIFLQKAQYGLRDNTVLESEPQDDLSDYTTGSYKDKYLKLIGLNDMIPE